MFDYKNIPADLRKKNRWVLWKLKQVENGRTTKVPVNAMNGYGAKSNDSSTWSSFEQALHNVTVFNCSGLGFMLGNGWFGIDIDHALDNKELISEFVNKLNSYTEVSQSGEGIHIICKGVLPQGARRKGNIEMYDNARFFALTGNVYENHTEVAERTEEVKELWNKYLNATNNGYVFTRNNNNSNNYITNSSLTDDEVISKIQESKSSNLFNCLYYGQWESLYPSQSEADMAFCSLLAFWCSRDTNQMDRIFRTSGLYRDKWDKKRGVNTYGEITLKSAIDNCKDIYTPSFNNKTQSYNPVTGEVVQKKVYDLSDTGNAQRFIDRFGSGIRYNFDNKYWVIWNGKAWVKDIKQLVKTQADILIEEMKLELVKEPDKDRAKEMLKNIKHLSSSNGKEAMLKEAMHLGDTPTVNADYDNDNYLLNCFNGVVDLRSGKLMPHDKKLMQSKCTNISCDLDKEPERWNKFLLEIFKDDKEMVEYVQTAIGYTLTGDTKEQCFFQCYGDGANGKSVFLDVLYTLLGDYSLNSQVESILARNNNGGASSEIARMNGARFVRTNEPNEGSRFNEGLVKQLVSGDVTTARYLYGQEFEFTPKFKLWIATNYKIQVRGTDYGIWRRMRLVPFEVKFEGAKADKDLTNKLLAELPQILGWAVKGCLKWQKEGMKIPQEIKWANNQYKQEMDIVATYLNENIKPDLTGKEKASEVYKDYAKWAQDGHEYVMTQSKFGIEMTKRFNKKVINGCVYYLGFILKKNDDTYVFTK